MELPNASSRRTVVDPGRPHHLKGQGLILRLEDLRRELESKDRECSIETGDMEE